MRREEELKNGGRGRPVLFASFGCNGFKKESYLPPWSTPKSAKHFGEKLKAKF